MRSIDNHYLLLALWHGEYALALMVAILAWTPMRLAILGIRTSRDHPDAMVAFALTGVFITFAVSIGTAWLGGQTQAMLFLVVGWGEGLLLGPRLVRQTAKEPEPVARIRCEFKRLTA
jgi:hypothetical protein